MTAPEKLERLYEGKPLAIVHIEYDEGRNVTRLVPIRFPTISEILSGTCGYAWKQPA